MLTMTQKKISRYIILLSSLLLCAYSAFAQQPQQRGIQYVEEKVDSLQQKDIHVFQGVQLGVDLAGALLANVSSYGSYEGYARFNIKEKYFPVVEVGLGYSNYTNDATDLHFKTNSPFIRVGCDYNFAKDKHSGNRVYGGVRLGYSSFKFNQDGPNIVDPIWVGQSIPLSYKNQKSNGSWFELVFGLEAKIKGPFHLGWTLRYKKRLSQKELEWGKAWCIPGYGENDNYLFTGTFNVILDI